MWRTEAARSITAWAHWARRKERPKVPMGKPSPGILAGDGWGYWDQVTSQLIKLFFFFGGMLGYVGIHFGATHGY